MKKASVISAFLIFGFLTSNAQTEKGTLLLGGAVSFQTSDGTSAFYANPNIGVFAWRNVALGAQFILYSVEGSNSWALGPFVRGYFAGSDKGKFFGQAGLNVGASEESDTELGFGVAAGYSIFLNQNIAIELGTSYNRTGDMEGVFGISAGFQIHFKK